MVDTDDYSSDTCQEPSIYPDPEHVSQVSWLAVSQSPHGLRKTDSSKGVGVSASESQHIFEDIRGSGDICPSPEGSFDEDAEYTWTDFRFIFIMSLTLARVDSFFRRDSENSAYIKAHGNSVSRAENERLQGSSLRGKRNSHRGRGIKRGPRKALEPDSGFKVLYSQATELFIARDYVGAEQSIQHAIRINPEIFAAHSLLSAIYMERGEKEQALTALFFGAHTRPTEKKVWADVAKLILERAGDHHLSAVRDAIYCYNRIIGLDTQDLEARRKRAALNYELGNISQALADYSRVLSDAPEDVGVLRRLAELHTELGEAEKAIAPFEAYLAHCQSLQPEVVKSFDWSDINIYAELCAISFEPQTAIQKVKAVARWRLGRLKERYWDEYNDDDREYDTEDMLRRTQVPQFSPGKYDRVSYGLGLPLELRVKLGILRLDIGGGRVDDHVKEAIVSPNISHAGLVLLTSFSVTLNG